MFQASWLLASTDYLAMLKLDMYRDVGGKYTKEFAVRKNNDLPISSTQSTCQLAKYKLLTQVLKCMVKTPASGVINCRRGVKIWRQLQK